MKAGLQKSIPRRIEYRSFKTYNNTAFVDDISKVPWSVIENVGNIDDAVFSWTTLFNDVAQEHALIKTKRAKGTHVPSMTNELSDLMRDRDYQHRKARGLKSGYHWNMFCKLRNAVRGHIRNSKSTYYVNLINESKGNSSKLWKAVNEVLPLIITECPLSLHLELPQHLMISSLTLVQNVLINFLQLPMNSQVSTKTVVNF